jgi:hypothetical protein
MLFHAVVLVCLGSAPPHQCSGNDLMLLPPVPGEHMGWSACMIAGTYWAVEQGANPERIKVVCTVGRRRYV